jgi:hypothetical protein
MIDFYGCEGIKKGLLLHLQILASLLKNVKTKIGPRINRVSLCASTFVFGLVEVFPGVVSYKQSGLFIIIER